MLPLTYITLMITVYAICIQWPLVEIASICSVALDSSVFSLLLKPD